MVPKIMAIFLFPTPKLLSEQQPTYLMTSLLELLRVVKRLPSHGLLQGPPQPQAYKTKDRFPSNELRQRLEIGDIFAVLQQNRL